MLSRAVYACLWKRILCVYDDYQKKRKTSHDCKHFLWLYWDFSHEIMASLTQLIDQEIAFLRAAQVNLRHFGIDLWSNERDLEEISRMI